MPIKKIFSVKNVSLLASSYFLLQTGVFAETAQEARVKYLLERARSRQAQPSPQRPSRPATKVISTEETPSGGKVRSTRYREDEGTAIKMPDMPESTFQESPKGKVLSTDRVTTTQSSTQEKLERQAQLDALEKARAERIAQEKALKEAERKLRAEQLAEEKFKREEKAARDKIAKETERKLKAEKLAQEKVIREEQKAREQIAKEAKALEGKLAKEAKLKEKAEQKLAKINHQQQVNQEALESEAIAKQIIQAETIEAPIPEPINPVVGIVEPLEEDEDLMAGLDPLEIKPLTEEDKALEMEAIKLEDTKNVEIVQETIKEEPKQAAEVKPADTPIVAKVDEAPASLKTEAERDNDYQMIVKKSLKSLEEDSWNDVKYNMKQNLDYFTKEKTSYSDPKIEKYYKVSLAFSKFAEAGLELDQGDFADFEEAESLYLDAQDILEEVQKTVDPKDPNNKTLVDTVNAVKKYIGEELQYIEEMVGIE